MMVMGDVLGDLFQFIIVDRFEDLVNDLCAFGCVFLHHLKFFRSKAAGFPQYRVINRDLAEVVHRRRLYQHPHEFITQSQSVVLFDFVGQNPYAFTGSSDMTAGRVVSAFNHGSHSHDKRIGDFDNVFCLVFHFAAQFLIEVVQQRNVLLVPGIIGNEQLIAALLLALIQIVDVDLVILVIFLIPLIHYFVFVVALFQPGIYGIFKIGVDDTGINFDVVEFRKDCSSRLITSQEIIFKVKRHEADIAFLNKRIHQSIGNIIQI